MTATAETTGSCRQKTTVGPASGAEGDNRRSSPRYRVDLDVTMASEHNFFQGFVENISGGGIFVATHALRSIGETMEVTFTLPTHDQALAAVCEVRWLRTYSETSDVPPGMGLRFLEIDEAAVAAIEAFTHGRAPLFYDD